MIPFSTFSIFCHKQIFIFLGILFIEWAPTYAINIYVKTYLFDNVVCLWILRNNANSSSSKHLRRCLIFPTSKRFPFSANPFKILKAIGCCCTLDRIIPKMLSLQRARSQICFLNSAEKDSHESES